MTVSLEAFSPFAPLEVEDSSLPATILEFSLKNTTRSSVEVTLAGWLENAVCLHRSGDGLHRNRLVRRDGFLAVECSAEAPAAVRENPRPNIVFGDFERRTYGNWKSTGTAFDSGPVEVAKIPSYQGDVAGKGKRVVNSHASAPGTSVEERDSATGMLTSSPFKIERHYITMLVGGGNHPGKTCVNLLVDGKVARTATGKDNERLEPHHWDVRELVGKERRRDGPRQHPPKRPEEVVPESDAAGSRHHSDHGKRRYGCDHHSKRCQQTFSMYGLRRSLVFVAREIR